MSYVPMPFAELERSAKAAIADNMEWQRLLRDLNPATILALLARVRALETAVEDSWRHDEVISGRGATRCVHCRATWIAESNEYPHKSGCIVETLPRVEP